MLLPKSQETYNHIIESLLREPCTAHQIKTHLLEKGVSISTSGLYKALGNLEESEVIIRNKTLFHISNEWKQSVLKLLGHSEEITIKDGESITFHLKSASQTDRLWKHYAFMLEEEGKKKGLYMYNPHQFWILIHDREQSEKAFIHYTKEHAIPVYHTIGSKTRFDTLFAQEFRSETYQINLESISQFSLLDNITVFGDYIINTQISEKLWENIDSAYKTSSHVRELKEKIADIVRQPSRYTFKLERNKKKALILSKRLSKHFFIGPRNDVA